MEMSAPASEVLAKVFLAHSYPGFFRTGDLIRRSCFELYNKRIIIITEDV
jgi:hypothetical protein